jgi:hypothetical protein
MIKQIKELLSEVQVHIQHDVNSTHISFSFKDENITEGPVPEDDIKAMKKCSDNAGIEKIYIDVSNAKEQTKKEIEKIVEATGAPKDNVVIATVPKAQEQPTLLDVETEAQKAIKARFKILTDLGWKLDKDQHVYGGIGLSNKFIETCSDADFDKAIHDIKTNIENSKKMEEIRKDKIKRANEIVQQATAESNSNATVTGSLISKEQQEMMEEVYAVPDDMEDVDDLDDIPLMVDDVKYKGKPATPEQAFDKPDKIETPPAPPKPPVDTDMYLIAMNPLEQMKRNAGKPYVNKAGVLITPEPKEAVDDESKRQQLWANLMAKCKANNIDVEGTTIDDQTIEDIITFDKWVDEAIEEQNKA